MFQYLKNIDQYFLNWLKFTLKQYFNYRNVWFSFELRRNNIVIIQISGFDVLSCIIGIIYTHYQYKYLYIVQFDIISFQIKNNNIVKSNKFVET